MGGDPYPFGQHERLFEVGAPGARPPIVTWTHSVPLEALSGQNLRSPLWKGGCIDLQRKSYELGLLMLDISHMSS